MPQAAHRLTTLLTDALGAPPPVAIRAWDGSQAGPPDTPVLIINNRRALRRLAWKPGELGLARGWVAGELDIEGDLYDALNRISGLLWENDTPTKHHTILKTLRNPDARSLIRRAAALAGPSLPPPPPPEEVRPRRRGPLHSLRRDRDSIHHHYDVGNDFYRLVLGPSMVYSCAYWTDSTNSLEEAQANKLDLVCRKLALTPGQRLLDVGCGWGSMALHAAHHYGVHVTGVTISTEQAELARKRVAEAGLTDQIDIRVQDYRKIPDTGFDAVSSIGMAEHVGSVQYREYTQILFRLLKPGGRLLNHQIARRPQADETAYHVDEFIDRYVFPDGELAPIGHTVTALEQTGFEVRDVEALREHYAHTLRAWVTNLEDNWNQALKLTTPGRARIWRLYMAASALAFEHNRIGVNQILAVKTPDNGTSGLPAVTRTWN